MRSAQTNYRILFLFIVRTIKKRNMLCDKGYSHANEKEAMPESEICEFIQREEMPQIITGKNVCNAVNQQF